MAKRKVTIEIDLEKSSAQKLEQLMNEVEKRFSSGFTEGLKTQFNEVYNMVNSLNKKISSFKYDEISKGSFDKLNKEVETATLVVDKFFNEIIKLSDAKIDPIQTKELTENIEESRKTIAELEKDIERIGDLSKKGTQIRYSKELFDASVSNRFEGFDGTPKSLGLTSIRKDIKQVDAYRNSVDRALIKLKELRELQQEGKLTRKVDKDSLKELEKDEKTLRILREVIDLTNQRVENDRKDTPERLKRLEEENVLLEKNEDLLRRLKVEASKEDPNLQFVAKAGGETQDIRADLQTTRGEAAAKEENAKAEEAEKSAKIEKSLINMNELTDDLIAKYFSTNAILRVTQKIFEKILKTISDLDAAFVNIAVVTQYTNQEVWSMYDAFSKIGRESGFSVAEIGKVAGEYFRQGESYSNVIKLTEAAAKAAKVAGIEAGESVRFLTSAVRGYNLAAEDAMDVSDKFAAVAASSATSYEGMATAMSKVAAQAYASNVEMDNLMGMMATSMEVTQEAPENIGTAFKTILARMAEIKDYGKVLEDGTDANAIEKALKTVNVELFDQNKNMKALDGVLLEVGSKWHTLNQSQKAYLATSLAGTRQQTRLLAVLENYDRTIENIETSRESAGATEAQQLKNTESIAHNLNRIQVATEGIMTTLSGSRSVISIISKVASGLEGIASLLDTMPGKIMFYSGSLKGLFQVLNWALQTKEAKKLWDTIVSGALTGKQALNDFTIKFALTSEIIKSGQFNMKNFSKGIGIDLKKSLVDATTGTITLTGAISALQAVLTVGLIAGAIFAVGKWALSFLDVQKRINKVTDSIKELNGEMYNTNKTVTDLQKLIDEYDELDKKIVKTTEDLERMKEVTQLIKDMDADNSFGNLANESGILNKKIADNFLKSQKEEREKIFNELQENRKNLMKIGTHNLDSVQKMEVATGTAIESMAGGVFEKWDEMDQRIKDSAINFALQLEESGKYEDSEGNRTSAQVDENKEQNKEITFTEDDIRRVTEYKDSIEEVNTTTEEYIDKIRELAGSDILAEVFIEEDALASSIQELGELGNVTISQLKDMERMFDVAKDYGADFSKETRQNLAKAFDIGGIQNFSQEFVKAMDQMEIGAGNLLNVGLSLIDTFDEITEDSLLDMMTSFDSMEERIENFGKALENFNTEALAEALELIRQYPEAADDMVDSIINTGNISEDIAMQMVQLEKEKTKTAIQSEIDQNEARIKMLKLQLKLAQKMAEDETLINRMASDANVNLLNAEFNDILSFGAEKTKAYKSMYENLVSMALEAGIKMTEAEQGKSVDARILSGQSSIQGRFLPGTDAHRQRAEEIQKQLQTGIDSTKSQIAEYENVNRLLQHSLDNIGTAEWNADKRFKDAKKDAGKAAKEAAKDVEIYTGELNKLYVAQKRLELVNWGVDLIKAKQAYAEAADAVKGLAGAQSELYDMNVAEANDDLYASYELQKEEIQNMIDVSEEYMKHLESKLSPALKGTYKVINGQVFPVSKKYKDLTLDQMKELDEFAKSFNELGSAVQGYKVDLLQAGQAQNELINDMRDTVIEYQELLIDAIKNEESKYLESFKNIIDANKKMLEERKKLYEDSFKEQDTEEELDDIAAERERVIEKLASLEAAHDITSIQKREEYRKQLQDLDDQFNNIMLERNREAFLESIDDQIQYQDDIYQKEEEAYQARIESSEWLEQRIKEIQDQGRIQAIIDNMLQHMTIQEMLDEGYITQEEITKAGITNMNATIDDLSEEQLGIFQDYWGKNRDVIDKMWNAAEGKVGAKKLSEDAMNHIITYLETHSDQMVGKTSLMKQKVTDEWRGLMTKVSQYTKDFNAITLEAPSFSKVTDGNKKLLADVKKTVDGIVKEYEKIGVAAKKASTPSSGGGTTSTGGSSNNKTGGGNSQKKDNIVTRYGTASGGSLKNHAASAQAAINQWGSSQKIYSGPWNMTTNRAAQGPLLLIHSPSSKTSAKGGGAAGLPTMQAYATGGTTERTGLHWLDGKPGAPERVLSPGANQRFEELLGTLTVNASEGSSDPAIVETLVELITAIYDSSEENARTIANALGSSGGSGGQTIYGIAKSNGISLNRRTDK